MSESTTTAQLVNNLVVLAGSIVDITPWAYAVPLDLCGERIA